MSPIRDIAVVNGLRLYYEIHGEGPWLVLIEGLGVATWLWEKQIPEFSRHFRVLAYDNRGTGKSDKPPGPYTVGEMAEDLAGLMEVLQIPRAHVLGISLGGYIAQEFALRYPERVDRLVLVATGHGGPDQVPIPPETVQQILEPGDGSRESVRRKLALAFS
ncbi:MAG: alpha/beta fold hydrolase, partial [Calditrichaeota bacterium]